MTDFKQPQEAKDNAPGKSTRPSKAPAISRAIAILRLLGKSEEPLGVQSIARELGLVPSTCLHVLRALVDEDLVSFNPHTKRYALEAGVLTLGQQWFKRNRFNTLVQPVLDRLNLEFNMTMVGLRIINQEHSIVVAVSQRDPNIQLSTQIGSRFSAFEGATGRCLAAFGHFSAAELKARFKNLIWDNPPTFTEWKEQIAETLSRGIAIDRGNYISGVTVFLAPVWDANAELNYALIAFGITEALQKTDQSAIEQSLISSAKSLTEQLQGKIQPLY